jgi:hypothetical protein
VTFHTTSDARQRIIIWQNGEVVARFYGDKNSPNTKTGLVSPGSADSDSYDDDVQFQFARCLNGVWDELVPPCHSGTGDTENSTWTGYARVGGQREASFTLAWGKRHPRPLYLHVGGTAKCKGPIYASFRQRMAMHG